MYIACVYRLKMLLQNYHPPFYNIPLATKISIFSIQKLPVIVYTLSSHYTKDVKDVRAVSNTHGMTACAGSWTVKFVHLLFTANRKSKWMFGRVWVDGIKNTTHIRKTSRAVANFFRLPLAIRFFLYKLCHYYRRVNILNTTVIRSIIC